MISKNYYMVRLLIDAILLPATYAVVLRDILQNSLYLEKLNSLQNHMIPLFLQKWDVHFSYEQ